MFVKSRLRSAICILILSLFACHLNANEEKLSGLVYAAPNTTFWLDPPAGWVIDNMSGKERGIQVVFYPKGGSFHDSPAILYANAYNKKNEHETLASFVEDELNTFKKKNKHFTIKSRDEYKIKNDILVKKVEIEADAPSNYETIAYIEQKHGVGILVLSAKTKTASDASKKAFNELIDSYREAGVQIEVPNQ